MRKKLLFESAVITTILAVLTFSAFSVSVFAWDNYHSVVVVVTDEVSFHVTARVTGYFNNPFPGEYGETLHQAYRGEDGVYTFYYGPMYYRWWSSGGSSYDTDIQESANENYDFQYFYPAQDVDEAYSWTGSYFVSSIWGYFYAQTNPYPAIPPS